MSSTTREILIKALEIVAKRGEDDAAFRLRCIDGVEKLTDEGWSKLGREAQDWYNDAVDDVSAGKPPRPFPDEKEEAPKAEEGGRRRRGASEAAPAPAPAKYEPKEGDEVVVVTKRGKKVEGFLVEITKESYFINAEKDGDEKNDEEVMLDKVESIQPKGAAAPAAAPAPAAKSEPEVGDTVQVVTKRGKTVMGVIQELTADEVVLKTAAGEVEDFRIDRLDGPIEVKCKGGAAAPAPAAESGGSRRRGSSEASTDKPAEGERKRSSNDGGVSIGTRIKEIMVENLGISEDDVAKQLKKEGIEFKENTLSLNYKDMKKTLEVLERAGKLKK